MNKKTLAKIVALHKSGVSTEVCVAMILEVALTHATEKEIPFSSSVTAKFINNFYFEVGV